MDDLDEGKVEPDSEMEVESEAKPKGYVRGTLLGSKLSLEGSEAWHAWREQNLKPLTFPVEGYDHNYGQEEIDAIDSTNLGMHGSGKRIEAHEYGSTKSPDDAPVGSLKDKWRLIPYFLQLRSLLRQHIDSFDYFVDKEMNDIVQSPSTREIKSDNDPNFFLRYEACWVGTPSIDEGSFQTADSTPALCRWRDCTYSAPIYVTIRYTRGNQVVLKRKQLIGRLPIMLRSKHCVLYGKTNDEIAALKECPLDPGGYFVVNGAEKVILIQEQLSKNRVILEEDSKGIVATITSSTRERKSKAYINMKNGRLYLKHNTLGVDVPIVIALKAMGMVSDMEIVQLIADDSELLDKMALSLEESSSLEIRTQKQALRFIGKNINTENSSRKTLPPEDEAIEVLANVVIPHIPVEHFNFRSKCVYIGYLARRVLQVHLGRVPLDDKDFLGNKRLELAGSLLSLLFEDLFKSFNSILKLQAERVLEKKDRAQAFDVVKCIRADLITQGMKNAISSGNWVIKRFRMDRAGVTQVLTRLSYMSALGMMTKINSQFEKTRKISGPRALQPSQWGMLCPADTPEGEACGLVKSLALLSHVTTGEADTLAIERLCRDLGVEDVDRMAGHEINSPSAFLVFLNGQVLGIHTRPSDLVRGLRTMRRRGLAGEFVSVYLHDEQKAVHIASDEGRVCRPLLIVDEETGLPRLKQCHVESLATQVSTVKQLLQQGIVEYVDVNEENNTLIAVTEKALEIAIQQGLENRKMRYTHLEIDPFTVLGVVGGVIPFPHHNQAPRNTYTVAMAKQAMGCIALNMYERTDGTMYSLIYPQKPMSKSRILDLVGFDQIPGGQNSCIAVMSYSGYDIEDAIIVNKASIDRGWGRCMVMRKQQTTIRRYPNGAADRLVGPPNPQEFKDGVNDSRYKRFKGVDIDGLCHVGTLLDNGSILVNKESPLSTNSSLGGVNFGFGSESMHSINYKHTPISYKSGAPSYVDRVMITSNDQVPRLIKVMTRQVRRPEIGDKFASRHGQKGVCGLIVQEQDLPFSESGNTVDLIMNPHGFPSRMTVGKLLELLVGKAGIFEGRQSYSTAFGEELGSADTAEAAAEALIRSGLNYTGKDVFYSGMNGEPLDAYIFSGPVFYQKLKHMVLDKIHARARGPRAVLTRQPMEGRARDGGLRLGEMERDCLIAYGASNLIMERLMHSSDAFAATVCRSCGLLQYENWCQYCRSGEHVTKIQLPYACKLLFQEMQSMNVIPRLRLEDQY